MNLDVKTDIAQALKGFAALEPRQFPFIVALAMNRTIRPVKDELRAEMSKVFDRPTPFALNGLRTAVATKEKLEAEVALREFAGKGIPASKFLAAQVNGGERRDKRFEVALRRAGLLPDGMQAVPASDAPLNQYGNVSGPYIVRILSYLRAFGEQGYRANRADNAKRRASTAAFYVVNGTNSRDHRGLPLGIYERKGKTSHMVIAFVKKPTYSKRYPFYEVAERVARAHLPAELAKAAEYAIKTSREGSSLKLSDFTALLPDVF